MQGLSSRHRWLASHRDGRSHTPTPAAATPTAATPAAPFSAPPRPARTSPPARPSRWRALLLSAGLAASAATPALAQSDYTLGVGTSQTVSSTITGSGAAGSVAVSGGGTLVLSGANTYSGGTTVSGTGTTLQVTQATPPTSSSIGTGTLTLDGGTLQGPAGGGVSLTFINPVQVTGNGGAIDSNGNPLTMNGNITDAAGPGGTLTLLDSSGGSGVITLGGSNSFSGTTAITNTYVIAGSGAAYSPGSAVQVGFAGTLAIGGFDNTIASLADGVGGGGDVQNDGPGPFATLTIDAGSGVSTTFSGQIRDGESGPFALAKNGPSTQILTGGNVFSGGTTVLGGTLVAGNSSALGSGSATVDPGGTLNVDNVAIANPLTLGGSGFGGSGNSGPGALSGTGTAEVDGAITLAGNTLLGVANATDTLTLTGVIGDGGNGYALAATGAGTLVLSGANTYSGGTTLCGASCGVAGGGGIVRVTNATGATSSSIGTGTLTLDGGTLQAAAGTSLVFGNAVQVAAGGGAVDANGTTLTLAGSIADATGATGATLTFQNSAVTTGTTVLSGDNTYSAGTVVASGHLAAGSATAFSPNSAFQVAPGATLDLVGNSNTIASLADGAGGGGTVTNNGLAAATLTLAGPASGTATFSGAIDDGLSALALVKAGAGTQVLSGTSTYSGGTTLANGILEPGDAGALGTGTLTFDGGSLLAGGSFTLANDIVLDTAAGVVSLNGQVLTLSGSISGAIGTAGLSVNDTTGTGTLVLSGTSTYTGATTVNSGTLQAGAANAFATGSAFTVAAGATLALNGYNQLIGSLAGAGSVTLGSATLTTGVDGTSTTFSGTISGAGAVTKAGAGTLILSGTNTYTGGTRVAAGTLSVAAAGNLGPGALTLMNNATLAITGTGAFANSVILAAADPGFAVAAGATATWNGVIADLLNVPAALSLTGPGTMILTAANTYTGGTTVSAGTLQIGAGGVTGSIASPTVSLAGGTTLAFDRADTLTYAGAISGSGALAQQGSGTLVLDGVSSGFAGATTIQSGTLEVGDASHPGATLGGSVTVTGSGTLMGHGTIGGAVGNSGNVRPGGTIGVLTVGGNYTQAGTGTLTIEITPNVSAGPGTGYDQLAVGGSASLAGTLAVLDDAGTYTVGSRYTILTAAAGRTGGFSTVIYTPLFAAYITPQVTYDANDVYLVLDPTPAPAGGPPALFNSGQEVPDMLTAEAATASGVAGAVLGDVCSEAAQRLAAHGQGCILHPLAGGYRTEVWLRGIGGLGSLSGSFPRLSLQDSYGGMLLGAGIGRGGFTLGAGGGFVATMLNFSNGSDAAQTAGVGFVYGRYRHGPLWLGATAAYGAGQVSGTRALPGTGLSATGHRPGDFAIVQGRAAYDLALGALTVEPRATLAYIHAGQSGFAETGGSLLDLSYAATHTDAVLGRLTARAMRSFRLGGWGVSPWAEAGVQETFSGLGRTAVVTDGAFSAGVSGVSPAPAAGILGLGIDAAATPILDLFLRYQGLFSANQTGNSFSTGLSLRF